jgi:peptidoglycan/xylan/chitin deacetylase (PgdA/CDA1 family)
VVLIAPQPRAAVRNDLHVSILAYHRFGPVAKDSMTVRTTTLRLQLEYLTAHDFHVVSLSTLVRYLAGESNIPPPPRAVVITVDDGHESVFTDMFPVARHYGIPVTLFIYPSAISNASYAMTWDQLATLQRTGLFDIQSHTFWHPNFNVEKRRLAPDAYRTFAASQFEKSRTVLKQRLGVDATMLAWPFGIYDDQLIQLARQAGYVAAVTLDRRVVTSRDQLMALPRFLVTDAATGRSFAAMLPEGP